MGSLVFGHAMFDLDRRQFAKLGGVILGTGALGQTTAASDDRGQANREPPGSRFPSEGDRDEPDLIAHRCFAGYYPENTLAAMEGACTVGSGPSPYTRPAMVEIDLIPTREETVVVFHDDRLDGKTDESGVVWLEDDDTVLNAEVLQSGETIPTLRSALETIPEWMPVQLDLKSPGLSSATAIEPADVPDSMAPDEPGIRFPTARWRAFVENVYEVVEDFEHDYLWSGFEPDALQAVRDIGPDQRIMYLWLDDNERGYQTAAELDAEAVGPSIDTVDRALVERAHADGREVNVFTADQWHQAERLVRLDVDGMISNYPRLWDFGRHVEINTTDE